jgi:hypothetical protein
MYSQKIFSKASLPIFIKYFQNRIIIFCLELYYSWREVQCYKCSLSIVSIGNNIFPNGFMKFQKYRRFIFPDKNNTDVSFNLFFPFLKYIILYIWDLGLRLANFFRDHLTQISTRQMNFQYIFFQL